MRRLTLTGPPTEISAQAAAKSKSDDFAQASDFTMNAEIEMAPTA